MKFSSRLVIKFFAALLYSAALFQSIHGALSYLEDGDKHETGFIADLTKHLHKKHQFRGFIYFRGNREPDQAPFLFVRSLEQVLVEKFGLPIIVWGKERSTKLRQIIGFNNLVFANIASIDDPILEVVDQTLEGRHHMPMLFIYKSVSNVPPTKQQIHEFFSWCWSKNIVNVALTFEGDTGNQVYKYSPFPVITEINLTSLIYTSQGDFILDEITDTHGHQFITPVFSNPPLMVLLPPKFHNEDKSKYTISGTIGRLYKEFVQYINGTIKLIPQHNMTYNSFYKYYFSKAAEKQIDIGAHPYAELLHLANLTEGSYPIGRIQVCIIVPVANEIKRSEYLILANPRPIWLLTIGLLLSLALLQVLCNKPFHLSFRRLGQALWNAFGMVLLQALPLTQLQNRRSRFAFFYVMAILLSLMLASIYTGSLTALFSKIVLGKQIETVDDLLQSNLKILVHKFDISNYFLKGYLPVALLNHLQATEDNTLIKQRDALNTSYGYVVPSEVWTMLNMRQQHLPIPRFRIAGTQLCTPQFIHKLPMQWDSPFKSSFTLFHMYTQASGLPLKWAKETMHLITEMKLIDIIEDKSKHPTPITVSHIENLLWLCVIMWGCSLLCFFGELIWNWWSMKRSRRLVRIRGQWCHYIHE